MPKKSRPTFQKREREKARQQKQKDKQARRLDSKERRADAGPRLDGEDPDIAGIRPGPQALPEQWELNSWLLTPHANCESEFDDSQYRGGQRPHLRRSQLHPVSRTRRIMLNLPLGLIG